jgi:hypothetical protein
VVRLGLEARRVRTVDSTSHETASPPQEVTLYPRVQFSCVTLVAVRRNEEQNRLVLPLRGRRTKWQISSAPTVAPTCQANELGNKSPFRRSSQHRPFRIWLHKCAAAIAGAYRRRVTFESWSLTGSFRVRCGPGSSSQQWCYRYWCGCFFAEFSCRRRGAA